MATLQSLKKKLQVINSTRKLTKAMKTASVVKYSRLSAIYGEYKAYADECMAIYDSNRDAFNKALAPKDMTAPVCYIVMSSNKGMCGSFNSELLSFCEETLKQQEKPYRVILCGKKAQDYFDNKALNYEKAFIFEDIPDYSHAGELFGEILTLMDKGRISSVKIIYPQYKNMMLQAPVCRELFTFTPGEAYQGEEGLYVPDKETFIKNTSGKILVSLIFKLILETALGAQAATLTSMRSAYDTATDYSAQLEGEINRKRQSQVTADVIEISAEYAMEEE